MPVTVYGDGFTPNSQVSVGGRLGIDMRVIDASRIELVLPPGVAGDADVRVTNENGTSVLEAGFLYFDEPEVISFEPADADLRAGDVLQPHRARGLTGRDGPRRADRDDRGAHRGRSAAGRIPAGLRLRRRDAGERGAATLIDGYCYVAPSAGLSVDAALLRGVTRSAAPS